MNIKKQLNHNNDNLRLHYKDPLLRESICNKIMTWLPQSPCEYVVVCIGTDRSTGDSLGPLTGSILSELKPKHINIHGTLHEPIHAQNLREKTDFIKRMYRNPFIIAIDACLGRGKSVGQIITGVGPLEPGAALNKKLPSVGNIHITGVVNISGFMEYSILQNTRLSIVLDMAKNIAYILQMINQKLTYNNSRSTVSLSEIKQQRI